MDLVRDWPKPKQSIPANLEAFILWSTNHI
jgi:hypothetical protein